MIDDFVLRETYIILMPIYLVFLKKDIIKTSKIKSL